MAFDRRTVIERAGSADRALVDEGLRAFMLKVYNYMCLGLGVTGAVAMFTASSEAMMQVIYTSPLNWIVMLSPLAFILVLSFGINKLSVSAAQALFWAFAVVIGLSMSTIFLNYTETSIAKVFFITAGAFAGLSLYGYTTKRNLSGIGSFLIMGVIGIFIASLVNVVYLQSSAMQFAISVIGVLIFAGLTAYDTQKLKTMYAMSGGDAVVAEKSAIMGALKLYLDFVNMFYFMLHLFGNRN